MPHPPATAPVAALFLAGIAALALCPRLPPGGLALPAVFLVAAAQLAVSITCAWFVMWKLRHPPQVRWRTAWVALWWAPLSILLTHASAWSVLAAGLLAAAAVRLVVELRAAPEPESTPPAGPFALIPDPPVGPLLGSVAAAALIQTGFGIGSGSYVALGAASAAAGSALVASMERTRRIRPTRHALASVALAVLALMPFVKRGPAPFAFGPPPSNSTNGGDVDFQAPVQRGIILIPETEPVTTLMPPLPVLAPNPFRTGTQDPLTIPFHGVYWLFQPPDRRPPPTSPTVRGKPDAKSFRINYAGELKMEARQNLGRHFDLSCCSRIDVAIVNNDKFPVGSNSMFLEVKLADTTGSTPPLSLGLTPITSRPDDGGPAREVLSFRTPAGSAALRRFDEITVVYHVHRWRAARSARVSVERFQLIPRGRAL